MSAPSAEAKEAAAKCFNERADAWPYLIDFAFAKLREENERLKEACRKEFETVERLDALQMKLREELVATQNEVIRLNGLLRVAKTEHNDATARLRLENERLKEELSRYRNEHERLVREARRQAGTL